MNLTLNTSFQSLQQDMFASGLARQIGTNAFGVWSAIKAYASYETGESYPSVKTLSQVLGISTRTILRSIQTLEGEYLLRVDKVGRRNIYIARERMDVRVGDTRLLSIAVDYIPENFRDKVKQLKSAVESDKRNHSIFTDATITVIPSPDFKWNPMTRNLEGRIPAHLLQPATDPLTTSGDHQIDGILAKRLQKLSTGK